MAGSSECEKLLMGGIDRGRAGKSKNRASGAVGNADKQRQDARRSSEKQQQRVMLRYS